MVYRHLYPLVRLFAPFLIGIASALFIKNPIAIPNLLLICLFIGLLAILFLSKKVSKSLSTNLFGIYISIVLFVLGYTHALNRIEINSNNHFSKFSTSGFFVAEVIEAPQEKEKSFKSVLRIKDVKLYDDFRKCKGKVLVYFAKDSLKPPPNAGDIIYCKLTMQETTSPRNPGSFDYKKYLATQNIYHQAYVKPEYWSRLDIKTSFNILRFSNNIREKLITVLQNQKIGTREQGVAAALIFGKKDLLDPDVATGFASAGVMHILSVSGLHVGIIYMVVGFLLKIFHSKSRKQKIVNACIIILSTWAYALITGMSPAVLRAATMFTFMTLGNLSNRYVHSINSITASAFLILIINPLLLKNIGFQLSYLAVVGIVFINPPINKLWKPQNRILKYFWSLIAVSIAAQLATSPISMYYFHQFPTYFILSNIIAVPLSGVVIYSALLTLVVSPIPFIANIVAVVCNFLIYLLIEGVRFVEHLPNSVVYINIIKTPELIALYIAIILFTTFVYLKRNFLFVSGLLFVVIFAGFVRYSDFKNANQSYFIVHSITKHSAISVIDSKRHILFADSATLHDKKIFDYNIKGIRETFHTEKPIIYNFESEKNASDFGMVLKNNFDDEYLIVNDNRIVVAKSKSLKYGENTKLPVDFLILTDSVGYNIKDILKIYIPKLVIIDASSSAHKQNNWIQQIEEIGIKYYSVKDEGAFVRKI